MAAGTVKITASVSSDGKQTATVTVYMTYYGNGETYDGAPSANNCWIGLTGKSTQYFTASYTKSTSAQSLGSKSFTVTQTTGTQTLTASGGITNYSSVYSNPSGSCSVSIPAKTSYTVSYNANGGSGAPASQVKWYNDTLKLSTTQPTRTGYTFAGWNTNSSGTGTNYSAGANYTSNAALTLYAKWTPVTYTVTYNANGGTNAPANQTKTYGVDLTLSSDIPTYSGYNFQGWSTTDTGGVEYNAGGTYKNNSAVILYAVWTVAYTAPSISNAVAIRCDADGNEKLSGDYVKLSFSWNGGLEADGTINPASITVTGDATYSETKTGVFSGDIELPPVSLPIMSSGSAVVTVTDTANDISATQTVTLPQGGVAIHISKTERAVEFFGIADDNETGVKAPSMTEAELNAFLDSLNRNFRGSVDWIVEEGTDNGWTYRKWDSGMAECWGIKDGTANHTRTWAGLSICEAINASFPTDLFIATPTVTMTNIGANSAVVFNGGAATQYQVSFQLGRGANANNIAYAVSIIAKGRWK